MLRNALFATIVVSAYLLLYCLVAAITADAAITSMLFIFSPFLLLWMAVTVLKDSKYKGQELGEQEEWGYSDRDKHTLGTF